jgi:hypothetical protein
VRAYWQMAQRLSRYWEVPFGIVLGRMVLGRIMYNRGPIEFDEFRFATKPVSLWRTFLPGKELRRLQEACAPAASRKWEEDKLRFALRCVEHGLPTVPITGVIPALTDGVDTSHAPSVSRIGSAPALCALFTALHDFDGFAKPLASGQGYGAFAFSVRNGRLVPSRHHATEEQMYIACATSRFPGAGYLLQPRVVTHEQLRPFMPGPGLGTVRVFSFRTAQDDVVIPFATLRIPAAGEECDNWQFNAMGASINVESGVIGKAVGRTTARTLLHPITAHPETAAVFADSVVPCWPEVLTLVRAAAHAFPMLPALGWDVAITTDGPLLIETNWQFGAECAEILTDRGWAAEFRALYARCARS